MSTAVVETQTNRIAQSNGTPQRQELSLEAQSWELAQRKATAYSKSSLVPKEFQNNMPNCLIAMNMAHRLGADVLMVMQNLYIVHGKPGWSSQFLIATFNMNGGFSKMRFEFVGDKGKPNYGCRAWAKELETNDRLEGSTITLEMAQKEGWLSKNGSKWQTMPDQMLMYRAASFFVRAYAPEISMGLHTKEELEDIESQARPIQNLTTEDLAETPVVFASKSDELLSKLNKPKEEKPVQNHQSCVSWLDSQVGPDSPIGFVGASDGLTTYSLPGGATLTFGDGATEDGSVDTKDADCLDQVQAIVERARKPKK